MLRQEIDPADERYLECKHLRMLEEESIYILREVAECFENPVLLYSIGKDSSVLLHLARKAFYPEKPPFPLLHIDSTWEFREMIEFRDTYVREELGMEVLVEINQDGVDRGVNPFEFPSNVYTDVMRTQPLKSALSRYRFDAAIGGGRREEERSRAKERIFSFRDKHHRWDPRNQRPELWRLYNTWVHRGDSMRVFPLSDWTEEEIWQYILLENIPLVPLYFSKDRPVVNRDGNLIMVDDDRMPLNGAEKPELMKVRFRTLGCYPVTGAIESNACTVSEIVQELRSTRLSERAGRAIDKDEEAAMERKKRQGYF
ncbi:sulfate adenylyltransferase subunit CysD [Bremerella cremea]|uniref:Sulfate adenylyltransferase subunit 2 n=1 Tax=Blastopirellula marina TaxID=124 RepID=A0A2S8F8I3_9BACT|nr:MULTISPECIES: sulfate adenylyltransferase subunit CysD [Pirellulaceae]PQO28473.1 sulfate adenylyltransferase subunit CysD [Blastopirellula marina]RCS41842.1 sulfate adenylyltransferase subunit CysD [Bremerella cremea]